MNAEVFQSERYINKVLRIDKLVKTRICFLRTGDEFLMAGMWLKVSKINGYEIRCHKNSKYYASFGVNNRQFVQVVRKD